MNVSAYWIIYRQNTNIERNYDTLIQINDNKTTKAFEHSCVLPQWCTVGKKIKLNFFTDSTPLRKDKGVFESFGRFIIVLLD